MAHTKKPGRFRKTLLERESELVDGLFAALKSPDPRVSLEATRLGLAYLYGRPSEEKLPDDPDELRRKPTEAELDEMERAMEQKIDERSSVRPVGH